MQSAALIVVKAESSGESWNDRLVDLRVDDHVNPVEELKRLLRVKRAYEHMNRGDEAIEKGEIETALKEYEAAESMFPENLEMKYWHAVSLVSVGKVDEALPLFKEVFAKDPHWKELTPRLPGVGLLPADTNVLDRIMGVE